MRPEKTYPDEVYGSLNFSLRPLEGLLRKTFDITCRKAIK